VRRAIVAVAVCASVVLAAGCGDTDGDGDQEVDPVAAAEQRVSRAQDAVDEAQGAFDAASDQFCGDAADYVAAVDRYGKVFTDAQATIGDVEAAGADLGKPQDSVAESAGTAKDAHSDLVAAEQELAEAKAALEQAKTSTTASADDETTTTTEPLVPPASVDRVTQAQEDLDAAFADVDKSTPLVEAGQQVNAAAVSLEMAWLRVLVDAGCLSDDQQAQAVNAAGAYTTALQNALTAAGLYDGPVDGVYGPDTAAAVQQLQADSGLPATGFVDQATADALDAALQAAGVDATSQEIAHTAALQSLLAVGGYWTGPIDGKTSDALTAALKELQTDLGVPVTGVVDAPTIAAAQAAIEELQNPTTTTTTNDSDESSSTTSTTAG